MTTTIFLPQSRIRSRKSALGLGERPVGGRDEEDQIRARHELGGDLLVLADDGVGAGRVDDVDVVRVHGRDGL